MDGGGSLKKYLSSSLPSPSLSLVLKHNQTPGFEFENPKQAQYEYDVYRKLQSQLIWMITLTPADMIC